ncbi:MAG: hypothetical protein KJ060_00650 [Candidatus Hydrogenedentes bacterium]|nr:hypothetical protein [Candidatus Hydrogenedentota bacterium]
MSDNAAKTHYLLLIRGTHWEDELSPEQIQEFMGQFTAWHERLTNEGKIVTAHPLASEGKLVSGKNGSSVADGPYAESKEAVGGFFLLQVDSCEEATAIAQANPILNYGGSIEVRPVIAQCSTMQRASEMLASSTK